MFKLKYPCKGPISSKFGWRTKPKVGWHSGLDLAVPVGTDIKACYKGVVIFAGERGKYGLTVILEHPTIGKAWTLYAHLSIIEVKRLQWVEHGSIIAKSGNTGWCVSSQKGGDGAHTHLEVRVGVNGLLFAQDPLKYLDAKA